MRLASTRTVALACLLLLGPTLRGAQAQVDSREGIALRNEIYQLRAQVETLQRQIASGGGGAYAPARPAYSSNQGAPNDMVAQLLSKVDALDEQVRQLRGRIDVLQNQSDRQAADLGKRIDDLAFQVQNGHPSQPGAATAQGGASAPPPALGPPPTPLGQMPMPQASAASAAPQAPVRRTPELAMQEGNTALTRRDYPAAEGAAREVLSNFRTSPRAYDAQFLLAEALAGEHQFSQAAIAYDDAYTRNRKGAHAPDALVGLANALAAINEKRAACDTLTKLHAEFPQVRQDLRDPITLVHQRAGCR